MFFKLTRDVRHFDALIDGLVAGAGVATRLVRVNVVLRDMPAYTRAMVAAAMARLKDHHPAIEWYISPP